jgi:hypothetical protein
MAWGWREDEELVEMMEEYPRIEPAIERMSCQDAELERVMKRLSVLESRMRELEGSRPQPQPQFGTGRNNRLLNFIKSRSDQ